jgi:hypothetical protein
MDAATLQRVAAAVTPAVMVSACGLLALGLDNQAARMTTRIRDLAREARALPPDATRRAAVLAEIGILVRRHTLYGRALLSNYAALLLFVLTSALSLMGDRTAWVATLPLVTLGLGVLMLVAMAVSALLAIRLSGEAIALEVADVGKPPT